MTKRNNSIKEMANQAECPDPKKLVAPPTVSSWKLFMRWARLIDRTSEAIFASEVNGSRTSTTSMK